MIKDHRGNECCGYKILITPDMKTDSDAYNLISIKCTFDSPDYYLLDGTRKFSSVLSPREIYEQIYLSLCRKHFTKTDFYTTGDLIIRKRKGKQLVLSEHKHQNVPFICDVILLLEKFFNDTRSPAFMEFKKINNEWQISGFY